MRSEIGAHTAHNDASALAQASRSTPCLSVVYPREMRQCFKLGVEPKTIGSGHNADIVLHDDDIAAIHCRISVVGDEVLIEDLGSSAGTWMQGRRVATASLRMGGVLRVGHYRFMLNQRPTRLHARTQPRVQRPGADPLTGMPNRAWVMRRAEQILAARKDSPRPVTLALIAVDHLARLQREHGYQARDQLLSAVSHLLEGRLREKEVLGVFGPETLLLVSPELDAQDVLNRLGAFSVGIRERDFDIAGQVCRVSLSIGACTRRGSEVGSLDSFLSRADRALYRSRRWGGDRVATLD